MTEINYYYNPYSVFFTVFWCLWTLFFAFNIYLYLKHKDSDYITVRSFSLLLSSAIGQYGTMTIQSWRIIVGAKHVLNLFELYHIWFFNPLHMIPYPLRAFQFILLYSYPTYTQETETSKWAKFWVDHKKYYQPKHQYFGILLLIICVPLLIVAIVLNCVNYKGIYDLETTIADYGDSALYFRVSLILTIIFLAIMLIAIFFMRDMVDDFHIRTELILMPIVWIVFIIPYCILGMLKIGSEQLVPIIAILECIVSFLVTFGIPIQLAIVKPDVVDENVDITFKTFLDDNEFNGKDCLEKFGQKHLCSESIEFLYDVKDYRGIKDDPNIRKEKFKQIKGKFYTDPDSYINVHIDKIKKIQDFPVETEEVPLNIFDNCYDDVCRMLDGNLTQSGFKKKSKEAQIFIEYYSDKIKAQNNPNRFII